MTILILENTRMDLGFCVGAFFLKGKNPIWKQIPIIRFRIYNLDGDLAQRLEDLSLFAKSGMMNQGQASSSSAGSSSSSISLIRSVCVQISFKNEF